MDLHLMQEKAKVEITEWFSTVVPGLDLGDFGGIVPAVEVRNTSFTIAKKCSAPLLTFGVVVWWVRLVKALRFPQIRMRLTVNRMRLQSIACDF